MLPVQTGPYTADPITWVFDFEMFFLFEIDVDAITLPMPRGCHPAEVRPGTALIGIGTYDSGPGNLGDLPAFQEVGWTVLVGSDLSRAMPMPRFAFAVGNVMSAERRFLDHAHTVDHMPVFHSPGLRGSFDLDRLGASFTDDHGPVLDLRSAHRRTPEYVPKSVWGQQTSLHDGESWFQAWRADGEVFEHQEGNDVGVIHPHPVWRGMDVQGLGKRCYLQIVFKPRTPVYETFCKAVPVGKR